MDFWTFPIDSLPTYTGNDSLRSIADFDTEPKEEEFSLVERIHKAKMNKPKQPVKSQRKKKSYRKPRDASIEIGTEWKLIEQIEFSRLSKLKYTPDENCVLKMQEAPEDDLTFEKITAKTQKPLVASQGHIESVTSSEDPVLKEYINGDKPLSDSDSKLIFGTDILVSLIMASSRSVYPWDILMTRVGNTLILDKRPDSLIDMLTVNETASDPPETDSAIPNNATALSIEATNINISYRNQVTGNQPPGYEYRQIRMGTSTLILRCQIDCQSNSKKYIVRCLNEYNRQVDWRQNLDSKRGSVIATELRNNAMKLSKWTFESILSESHIKLGFVSRVHAKDPNHHSILGQISLSPEEFAGQINMEISNGFGILKAITDLVLSFPEGKYILVKDANRGILRIYETQ